VHILVEGAGKRLKNSLSLGMAKKRKLNSKNPKYSPKQETPEYKKVVVKVVKGCKITFLWGKD
jgi:hypothetical protein